MLPHKRYRGGRKRAKRNEHVEFGASHSTDETGEANPSDPVEGRASRNGDLGERKMTGTGNPKDISTRVDKIASIARKYHDRALSPLAHHMDITWLREAHKRTRRDGATGIDGRNMAQYEEHLEENLLALLDRAKSGRYRAPAVRRVHIPKEDGRMRPIGVPTVEDKILQRAVTMILEAVYEQEFLDCSYGFRPGRSAHQALEALWKEGMVMGGGWVLEADIEGFFDAVDRGKLREIFCNRVSDGVLVRLIGKWLNAGVMEDGHIKHPDTGTPQGGVISPMLANIYLHEVLDKWFAEQVCPRLQGRARLFRYADDFVIIFEREEDARKVHEVLPKRFGNYGLRLHPDKTRLVPFQKPNDTDRNQPRPGNFDLLGFRHYWGKSQKGNWVIRQTTKPKRKSRALKSIGLWCRRNRHRPLREQHRKLTAKLRGHDAYFGIPGNAAWLHALRYWTRRIWKKWLGRRNSRHLTWERYTAIMKAYPLPAPRLTSR